MAVQPHERIIQMRIKGQQTPAGFKNTIPFRQTRFHIGKMMEDARENHNVKTFSFDPQLREICHPVLNSVVLIACNSGSPSAIYQPPKNFD